MSFDIKAVSARSNMGWTPGAKQLEQFQLDTEAAFKDIKKGKLSIKQASDALHVSEGTMKMYYDQFKDKALAGADMQVEVGDGGGKVSLGAYNMMTQIKTSANMVKQFVDKLLKDMLKAFEGNL